MKRSLFAVAALIAILPLAAQTTTTGNQTSSSEPRLLSIELGLPVGYKVSSSAVVSGSAFGLSIPVSDNFSVGIASTQIGTTAPLTAFNTLRLSYTVIPMLGASIFIGQSGANVGGGLGLYSTLAQGKSAAGLVSALRLRIDYLFDTTAMTGGSVVFTTAVVFGI